MENLIETHGLCKQYSGIMRVNELSMMVPQGAVYGFLGPNGAGKSTTLKMLLGLAHPTKGHISIFGESMNRKNRLGILQKIGSLIESPSYYGHLTGEENLRIVQTLRGVPAQQIGEVLHLVRLDGQKDKRVRQYSLGMKQRLGLAAALLGYPNLLILDEPTNGLDPAGIQEMRDLIRSLPEQYGMTVVISSHLLTEIDQVATHVGIIANGKLVYQDTLSQLHEKSECHLQLRTLNDPIALEVLHNSQVQCVFTGNGIDLPALSDTQAAQCIQLLAQNRIGVVRLEERKKSLEDIFLTLTNGAVSL